MNRATNKQYVKEMLDGAKAKQQVEAHDFGMPLEECAPLPFHAASDLVATLSEDERNRLATALYYWQDKPDAINALAAGMEA